MDRHDNARVQRNATAASALAKAKPMPALAPKAGALTPGGVPFETALIFLKLGYEASRMGWNGKGMWIEVITDWSMGAHKEPDTKRLPFIAMKTVGGAWVPWLASQTDILAHDWVVKQDGIEISEGSPVPTGLTSLGNQ